MNDNPTDRPFGAGDARLIEAASNARNAMEALTNAATDPLYDPHTIFRAVDRLKPIVKALAETFASLRERVDKAAELDLLVPDNDDVDITEATRDARFALDDARVLAENLTEILDDAEVATAGFKPRQSGGQS